MIWIDMWSTREYVLIVDYKTRILKKTFYFFGLRYKIHSPLFWTYLYLFFFLCQSHLTYFPNMWDVNVTFLVDL
jgi:hypothetical protein